MRSVALALAGAIVGFAAHAFWSSRSSLSAPQSSRAGYAAVETGSGQATACDWQHMRAEIRQVVREELSQHAWSQLRGAAGASAATAAAVPSEPAQTEENKQADAAQAGLVSAALKDGRWTEDDVMKLRGLLPMMSASERPKALAGIAKLINEGRLKVEATVPF